MRGKGGQQFDEDDYYDEQDDYYEGGDDWEDAYDDHVAGKPAAKVPAEVSPEAPSRSRALSASGEAPSMHVEQGTPCMPQPAGKLHSGALLKYSSRV